MDKIFLIALAIIAYLLGSISTSILVSKIMMGFDLRDRGSGNAGTTNALRTMGKKAALYVLIGDLLKGIVAVLIARIVAVYFGYNQSLFECVAAFAAVMGHNFPVYFKFKGGKGVLTSFAVILMLDWKIALLLLLFEIIIIVTTRFVSLGSCLTAVLFMILATIFKREDIYYLVLSYVLSIILIVRHRTNIKRLIKGEESKIKF